MRAHITFVPRDTKVYQRILEQGSRYPYTSVCLIPSRRGTPRQDENAAAGSVVVYSALMAEDLTSRELDLALRSMVQHFHHLPLELGAADVDPKRRKLLGARQRERNQESKNPERTAVGRDRERTEARTPSDEKGTNDKPSAAGRLATIDEDSLASSLLALDELVGLSGVKREIEGLVALARLNSARRGEGASFPFTPHLVFVGNPGTCKTTVAAHLAGVYHALGLIPKKDVKVASRADLVAAYVGQTALKTKALCQKALGGMLFIDEAYGLTEDKDGFGNEAVEALLLEMENHRGNLAVVIAGYPERMTQFLSSNPGLQSRFDRTILFADYTNEELTEIFVRLAAARRLTITPPAMEVLRDHITRVRRGPDFGNGREARRWLESALEEHARMWVANGSIDDSKLGELGPEAIIRGFERVSPPPPAPTARRIGYL
jgi:SpoVK/Ycf46/Vps4 family AAA+-type ATPase